MTDSSTGALQSTAGPSRTSTDASAEPQQTSASKGDEQAVNNLSRKHSLGTQPARASSSSPSKATARSEAGAKMRAALSASSSPLDHSTSKFVTPGSTSGPSFSAAQMKQPAPVHLDVPHAGVSSQRSPTSPAGPKGPYTVNPGGVAGPSQQVASEPGLLANGESQAPLMSASGRTTSTPGTNSDISAGGINPTGPTSANGRARASTSSVSTSIASAMAPPQHYSASSQSSRGSPSLRAQSAQHQPPAIPPLGGVSSGSVAPAPGGFSMPYHSAGHQNPMTPAAYERHTVELTNCIIAFLSPILPTEEEYRIKEATRRQLERLASKVSPGAKLLAFGSMANGFALRNSDMDLCCLIGKRDGKPTTNHTPSELVEILSQLIREETDFNVMPLPKARIPIIKISRAPTPELPYEISCDIGFENRLALENTRLLLSYAMVDPPRLRTLVLFLKVWTKRRKLNSPYTGTLSSYGYTLLALYFLTHVKRPPVLPNLQRIPPTRQLKPEELELNGHNIYFYDDVATLRKEWNSQNTENVGELLIEFFRYFSKEFSYTKDVISLRTEGGLISKDSKNWASELCIEDPFQMGYNVSRTVTKDGLYTIRGEFMRATRILMNPKSQRVSSLIAELCEEREDGLSRAPDVPYPRSRYHNGPTGVDGRSYRDMYSNPRRYDAPSFSGYGGSFAFEQMARGLGQGIAYPPSTAMLAPLSRNHGLSSKQQPPRFAHAQEQVISSGQSDTGPPSSYDNYSRASIGHASARTSPSFKHALPSVLHPSGGPNAQEAFAYGAEISFGPDTVNATRDDMAGPRTKTARSLSESLNRSKSLPRAAAAVAAAAAAANGDTSAMLSGSMMAGAGLQPSHPGQSYAPRPGSPDELEGQLAGLSVASVGDGKRRLSSSSHASMLSEGINGGQSHHYSTSPTWSYSQQGQNQRRGSHSTSFHHHPQPHGHAAAPLAYGHASMPQAYLYQQQQQQQHSMSYQQHDSQRASPQHPPQQQVDTRAMLQEYLRRASEHAEPESRPFASDNDDACSVISEATLDELARLSALDTDEHASPQLKATAGSKEVPQPPPSSPPRTACRVPNAIIEQAKNRRKAEQATVASSADSAKVAATDQTSSSQAGTVNAKSGE